VDEAGPMQARHLGAEPGEERARLAWHASPARDGGEEIRRYRA
jgi:hypothetical protein